MTAAVEIRQLQDIDDPDVVALVAESDAYLSSLYPPESNHAESTEALVGENAAFFVAYIGEQLVGCCAVKIAEEDVTYGEIKRLFVDTRLRGRRLGVTLVEHVESYLRNQDVTIARLEAGPMQPEALALYARMGYEDRGPFGPYKLDPLSVFMEKVL
jgi:putative acetyltransferase